MEDTGLAYAVIIFTSQNTEFISTAPKIWLNENNKTCMWPKSKGVERKAINLKMKPENDWKILENVRVVGYYETLKEAMAVEKTKQLDTSASESEEHTGKRKITLNKKYRDDSVSPPPEMKINQWECMNATSSKDNEYTLTTEDKNTSLVCQDDVQQLVTIAASLKNDKLNNGSTHLSAVTAKTDKIIEDIDQALVKYQHEIEIASISLIDNDIVCSGSGSSSSNPDEINLKNVMNMTFEASNEKVITPEDIRQASFNYQGDPKHITALTATDSVNDLLGAGGSSMFGLNTGDIHLSDIMTKLKEIEEKVTFSMHKIAGIEKNMKYARGPEQKRSLLPNLPLMELTQLETLEERLSDGVLEQQLFDLLRYTGGSRERDCVNRCLEKIFSNYLAQFCSWTGKKHNYKLSSLKLMSLMKRAVNENFPNMTEENFQRHTMNWFQHATTRLKRSEH